MNHPHKPRFEIFIDGGVRRATDVLKAVALGATAVGIGRPMIYAMSTYGEEGVCRLMQILKDEFEMNMRLIGARNMGEVVPGMVDTSALNSPGGNITMYDENCEYRGGLLRCSASWLMRRREDVAGGHQGQVVGNCTWMYLARCTLGVSGRACLCTRLVLCCEGCDGLLSWCPDKMSKDNKPNEPDETIDRVGHLKRGRAGSTDKQ